MCVRGFINGIIIAVIKLEIQVITLFQTDAFHFNLFYINTSDVDATFSIQHGRTSNWNAEIRITLTTKFAFWRKKQLLSFIFLRKLWSAWIRFTILLSSVLLKKLPKSSEIFPYFHYNFFFNKTNSSYFLVFLYFPLKLSFLELFSHQYYRIICNIIQVIKNL